MIEITARIDYNEQEIRRALLELKESGRELNYDNISVIFLKYSNVSFPKSWTATNPPPQKL